MSRKRHYLTVLVLAQRKTPRECKSPSHTQVSVTGKDLVSQLDTYAVSLMERTGGYGPSDMGSIPVLRAIRRNLWVLQQVKLPVWCNWLSRAGVVLARSPFKSEDLFAPCFMGE